MTEAFLILGSLFFISEIGRHLFTIYIAVQMNRHDKYCEDCAEQELINEIRKK